jgi:hypothetical protein
MLLANSVFPPLKQIRAGIWTLLMGELTRKTAALAVTFFKTTLMDRSVTGIAVFAPFLELAEAPLTLELNAKRIDTENSANLTIIFIFRQYPVARVGDVLALTHLHAHASLWVLGCPQL